MVAKPSAGSQAAVAAAAAKLSSDGVTHRPSLFLSYAYST
jgi:hypothetical protein